MNLAVDFREEVAGNSVRQRSMQIKEVNCVQYQKIHFCKVLVSKNLVLMLCVAHMGAKI